MKRFTRMICGLLALVMMTVCSSLPSFAATKTVKGTLRVCTYNVSGLPFAGTCNSLEKAKKISSVISKYDITNVQENFTWDAVIRANLSDDVVSETDHNPLVVKFTYTVKQ